MNGGAFLLSDILVVEDEIAINELICRNLTLVGHNCVCAFDGESALKELSSGRNIDLMLLDIMLPGLDGINVLRLRPDGRLPVIVISALGELEDRVRGLETGADDYIVKPFETLELLARVNALLRRAKRDDGEFSLDSLTVDLKKREARLRGVETELTPQEFALLETLIVNRNLALSREKLIELAWGFDYMGDTRTVDVHIQKLRKKLELTDRIKTVYKLGYRLETR